MPHTEPRDYYVSLRRGTKTALLAGPFATHTEALAMVDAAGEAAYQVDPFTWHDARGTCSLPRVDGVENPKGKLNSRLGLKL